jgi:hypothetical protein
MLGFVPEVLVAKEFGPRVLLGLRYRFVGQSSATFYAPTYSAVLSVMAGDDRLGSLNEHAGALSLRWTFLGCPGGFGSLGLVAEEELSRLRYELINLTVLSSVTTGALVLTY